MLVVDYPRCAGILDLGHERRVHLRDGPEGLYDCPGDEVREADLPARGAPEVVVDRDPVDLEKLGRHRPHARGRGHDEAGAHVLDHTCRCPAKWHRRGATGRLGRRRGSARRGGCLAQWALGWGRARHRRLLPVAQAKAQALRPPWTGSRRRTPASSRSPTGDRRDRTRTSPRRATHWCRRRPRACPPPDLLHHRAMLPVAHQSGLPHATTAIARP